MLLWSTMACATTFSDLKFGKAQLSDTQWNVSACMYTSTCQIYSLSGIGTSWNTGSPYTLSTTQYIQFSPSNDPNNPWTMKVYNSNGTVAASLGNGRLAVQGVDSVGHHFFFFTNPGWNGTVFSTDYGFPNSNGFSFTGTGSPTVPQTNTFAGSGSTSVLAPGQTYTATPAEPTYPVATISSTQQTKINQTTSLGHNRIYINNTGDFNAYNIEQKSDYNAVRGINGAQEMTVSGSHNTVNIVQGTSTTLVGQNLAEVSIIGSNNALNLTQQNNSKYTEVKVNGAGNNMTVEQKDAGGKSAFINIASSLNTVSVLQQGSGNHFVDVSIPNGGSNVSISQSGTAQKMFSLTLNSSNIGVTVVQDNATTADSAAMSITCTSGSCIGYTYTKH